MAGDTDPGQQKYTHGRHSRRSSLSLPKVDQVLHKPSSRHSPLAPLEYLQNQRRGSITDPSLHAAPSGNHGLPRLQDSAVSSSYHDRNSMQDTRPTSPYVFGDATPHSADYSSQQIRKLLRSPSTEVENSPDSPSSPREPSHSSHETTPRIPSGFPASSATEGSAKSSDMTLSRPFSPLSSDHSRRTSHRDPPSFDYNMRRHSISVGQDPHSSYSLSHGTKRKMSSDRNAFSPVGEEIDPQLVGPGVPSVLDLDEAAPAPKRRGSAIDTQRIAQLSLYDRRNSVDSRGSGGMQWWLNERRDSASSSIFSSPSSVGYGSGFPADSPHGRPTPSIAAFAWPSNSQSSEQGGTTQIQSDSDATMSGPSRPYDSNVPQLAMMPPLSFASDRRMSVPENMAPTLPGGGSRVLRSRSRPPSRQLRSTDAIDPAQTLPPSGSNVAQDEQTPASSPSASGKQSSRESQPTPYSRSPELRISHKLAERKRRKEMKDLFDELRDQLPADRGMKASKWEILSKAIDFISQLKQSQQDMLREIDVLRHEVDSMRQGIPPFGASGATHPVVYSQAPVVPGHYPPGTGSPHTAPPRPPSQDTFSSGGGSTGAQTQNNGAVNRTETVPT